MGAMFWITATPRNVATGAAVTVRLAGGGAGTPYYRSPNHFRAGIVRRPRFTAKAEFGQDGLTGGTVPTTGKLRFKPSDKALLAQLGGYFWKEAPITVEAGPEGGPYSTILTGTVVDATAGDDGVEIEIADLSQKLNKPLVTARFAGTGGAEGGPEAEGRVKRRSWGRVFNVEGRVLDKTTNVYEFGDLAFQASSFAALRDMGRAAAPAPTSLAWQGSVAATLTALKAAACAEGSGVVAASIQCAKWWTQPAGPLTADLLGETTSGYVETAPSIAARISAAVGGPAISNTASMDLLRPEACGLHIGDGDETAAEALDRLLLGVSLLWVLEPAGAIVLRELSFDAPAETIQSRSVRRLRTFAPIKTRRVGYQKSQRIHSDAEISVAIVNLVPFLTQESHTVPADSAGVVTSYAGATGQFRIYSEGVDVSSSFTLATAPGGNPQSLAVNYAGQTYTVTGGLDAGEDNATLTIRATGTGAYAGITRDKVLSLGKSKAGAAGADAKLLAVISDRQTIYYDSGGSPSPSGQTTTFTAQKVNTTATVTWSVTDISGNPRTPVTSFLSAATGNSVTMTEAQFASARNSTTGVIVTGTLTDGVTLADKISVVRVAQGAQGDEGPEGPEGPQGPAGAAGTNNALAWIFKRSASAPALPTATATYTFATGAITGLNNGWSASVPAPDGNPLYVSTATASSSGASDAIAAGEWAAPVVQAQDGAVGATGAAGAPGTNAATIFLFKRTATNSAPAVPSASTTYTFATAALAGIDNGWSQAMPPDTDGAYLWVTTASALGTGATDAIATGEWATPRLSTDAATIAAVAAATTAITQAADDGVIDRSEKKRTIDAVDDLNALYAALEGRRQELGVTTNARNLIAYSRIDATNWSGPPTQNGTTIGYDGSPMEWWELDDKFLTITSADALVVGASYVPSFRIKHNQPGAKYSIMVRRVGGSSTADLTNNTIIEVTDEYQDFVMPQVALGSSQTAIMFDGRTARLATLGLSALPAGFSIAVDELQLETGTAPSPAIRTNGAAVTQNYLTTARAEFLAALRMIFPRLRDMNADSYIFPADNELPTTDLSGWSTAGNASRTDLGNGFARITDDSGSAMEYLEKSLTTPAEVLTMIVVIDKDATGRATRFPRFAMRSASDYIAPDTATGQHDADAGGSAQVLNGGDVWVAVRSRSQSAGSNSLRAYPARGAGSAWPDDVAATGSVDVKSLTAFFGDFTAARRRGSFRRRMENMRKALARLQKAISGTDGTTGLVISPLPETIIECDYQGNIKAGQLDRQISFRASVGNALVTALTAWSEVTPAGFTGSIGAATGVLTLTTPMTGSEGEFSITGVYLGVTREVKHRVRKVLDDPPSGGGAPGGGGGTSTSGSDSSLGTFASTTPTVVSAEIEVTAATTTATLTAANLSISTARTAPEATYEVNGKWQRATFSGGSYGAFADVTTPTTNSASDPDCSVVDASGGEPGVPTIYVVNPGSLTVNRTSTVVVGTKYKFRLLLWNTSGTRTMIPTGTASVTT